MNQQRQGTENKVRKIMFLCTGNSCRSQMAEGLVNAHWGGRFQAVSAGTHPVPVNPNAVKVMREAGYDISGQRSQSLDEFRSDSVDLVISVCVTRLANFVRTSPEHVGFTGVFRIRLVQREAKKRCLSISVRYGMNCRNAS